VLGNSSSVAEQLSTNVLANGCGSIQLQQHVGLEDVLGPVDLKVGDAGAQPHPFLLNIKDHVLLVHLVGDKVDTPKAGVLVARVKGLEGGAEVLLGAVMSQLGGVVGTAAHGPVPGSNDGVGHHQGDVVGVRPSAALNGKSDVCEGHAVITDPDIGASVPIVF
jgi:hypothetical protein